jgi:AcrR family transcriptional regulator
MTADNTQEIKAKIVQAALDCAADMSWDSCGFIDIAARAGVELSDMYLYFEDKDDVLLAYGRQIDAAVVESVGAMGLLETCRDRLFDVLMERFEYINANRAALLSVLSVFNKDPKQVVTGLPHLGKSMARMLEVSGFDTSGMLGAVRIAGLTGLYLKVLHVWKYDDSPDLARVMAALDKDLRQAEAFMDFLSI